MKVSTPDRMELAKRRLMAVATAAYMSRDLRLLLSNLTPYNIAAGGEMSLLEDVAILVEACEPKEER